MLSREGEQLELALPGVVALKRLPWGGRSPRELTRVSTSIIFKAQAVKAQAILLVDEGQYDLWLPVKKAPGWFSGAPSLLPLRRI